MHVEGGLGHDEGAGVGDTGVDGVGKVNSRVGGVGGGRSVCRGVIEDVGVDETSLTLNT